MAKQFDGGRAAALSGAGIALGAAAFGVMSAVKAARRNRPTDDAPAYTAKAPRGEHAIIGRTVTIRKPREELYKFWRDFSNLPQVMENVESITAKNGAPGHSVWRIKAPAGQTVEVETEISEERENELIAWRSLEGSDIATTGRVSFEQAPGDRGTRVSLIISYDPPGGGAGRAIAKAFMREPEVQARHDLKRFKMLMETGEIATSAHRKDKTRAAKQETK